MNEINVVSPTRVDLAGGTLDCWPLNAIVGTCYTVNLSISVSTYVKLIPKQGGIELNITDFNYQKKFSDLNELMNCPDKELTLVRSHLKHWQPEQGFYLETRSESPVGGGLGGSSSLSVSLIKAFAEWNKVDLSQDKMIRLASNVEAHFLNTPTGTQDYIGAFSHGLNIIKYDYDGIYIDNIDFDYEHFNDHLMVVYTGKSHHSGINNWQVIKEVVENNSQTVQALKGIADISSEFAEACRRQDWQAIPELLNRENEVRVQLSAGFSNPEIEDLKNISFENGAEGFKICGAGGGGCVMIWAAAEKQQGIKSACQEKNYQVLEVKPVTQKV